MGSASTAAARPRQSELLPLYVVVFAGFVGYSLMITTFTPMLLDRGTEFLAASASTGQRTIALGALLMLYPLGQFLGSPVLGALSDRFGRRGILLVSLSATTAWYAVIALAVTMESLPLLMVACFCAGLSEANIVTAQGAIADRAGGAERGRLFGYVYLAVNLAYVVGPLAGGKLAEPGLASFTGYPTPYWVVCGLLALTLVWVAASFRDPPAVQRPERVGYLDAFTNLRWVFLDRGLRGIYLVNVLFYLSFFGFFRVYPIYLVDEFGMGVSEVSEYIAFVAVPLVIANAFLVSRLERRFTPRALGIAFGIVAGVFMATIVIPDTTIGLWPTLGLTGLGIGVCLPVCATMISLAARDAEQGRALGNNQSLQVGAEALSGVAGGGLAAVVVRLPLLVFGGVALIGALTLSRLHARRCQV